ncbi:DMT family transporter [Motiliproteus sediminis]|uniref:DMT family transporter n=1 Tax=Motiliproteus sediminis TaxID=1468178 RepID=UPI001AEF9EA8|nr:DMT family transporter [Motiliproteus sediminis]
MSRSPYLPTFCLITAMLLWASSFVALKLAFQVYDPMVVIFGRMAVASLCFLLVFRWIWRFEYRRGDYKYLLLMAVAEPCLYFLFETAALQNTTAGQAGMITALAPLMVAVGAYLWFGERVTRTTLLGFALAIVGACWLSLAGDSDHSAPNPLLGNFLEFLAMVCATVYTLSLKHLADRYSTWLLTAVQAWLGGLFFFPFLLLPQTELPTTVDAQGLGAILYLGTLINIGAYGLYNFALSRVPAGQASGFINLIPVFTLALAYLVLGETLNSAQILASVLVFTGVYISQSRRRLPPVAGNAGA